MTAIQRWYFYEGDQDLTQAHDDLPLPPIDDQWCKAADVALLEEKIKQYLVTIQGLRKDIRDLTCRAESAEADAQSLAYERA